MKKINISDILHRKRRILLSVILPVFVIIIFWINSLLNVLHSTSSPSGASLRFLVQLLILCSIVAYPICATLFAVIISQFRRLKSQEEGGLISDALNNIKLGAGMFGVLLCILIGIALLNLLITKHIFIQAYIGFLDLILMLFSLTAIGVFIISTLPKEFDSKKIPIEKFPQA